MTSRITVYQSFYENWQIEHLDSAFVPCDCSMHPHPQLYETYWILKLYESGGYRNCDYSGLFSWKFFSKAKIPGSKFIEFVEKNPGYDVYFINPFPLLAYLFFNIWDEGEHCHPGLVSLSQSLIAKAKYPFSIPDLRRNNQDTLLYCNYWVGNEKFWDTYIGFMQPLFGCCRNWGENDGPNPFFRLTMYEGEEVPFFPFVFERLFSTLLLLDNNIAACPFTRTFEELLAACDNSVISHFIKEFGPAIDEMDRHFRVLPGHTKKHRELFQAAVDTGRPFAKTSK